jgi:hypothetical protein
MPLCTYAEGMSVYALWTHTSIFIDKIYFGAFVKVVLIMNIADIILM